MNLNELYEDLRENEFADYQIRKMLQEGKLRRAKISIMEFAKEQDVYLDTDEALNLLERFRETDMTADERTQARFPDEKADLGMDRDESIVDPAHRMAKVSTNV